MLDRLGFMPQVWVMKKAKRPSDINQRAKAIIDIATGERSDPLPEKNQAAVELGRLGGLKGGKARAKSLSKEKRAAIAKKAAAARWKKG